MTPNVSGASAEAPSGRSGQEKAAIREAIMLASAVAGVPVPDGQRQHAGAAAPPAGPPTSHYLTTVSAAHPNLNPNPPSEGPRRPSLAMSIKSGFIDGFARRRSDQGGGRRSSNSGSTSASTSAAAAAAPDSPPLPQYSTSRSRVSSTAGQSPDRPRFSFSFRRGSDSPQQELSANAAAMTGDSTSTSGWRSRRSIDVVRALPSALGMGPPERRRGSASDSSGLPTPSSSGRLSFAADELPSSQQQQRRPSLDVFSSKVRNTLFRKTSTSDVSRQRSGISRRSSVSNARSADGVEEVAEVSTGGQTSRSSSRVGEATTSSQRRASRPPALDTSAPVSGLQTPLTDSDAMASSGNEQTAPSSAGLSYATGSIRDSFFSARSTRTPSSAGSAGGSPVLPPVSLGTPPTGLRGLVLSSVGDDKAAVGPRGETLRDSVSSAATQNLPGAFPFATPVTSNAPLQPAPLPTEAASEPRTWTDSFSPHATSPSERASSESSVATGHTSVMAAPIGAASTLSDCPENAVASPKPNDIAQGRTAISLADEAQGGALGVLTSSPAASIHEEQSRSHSSERPPRRSTGRSHLAHMPRLNSMATLPGSSGNGGGGGGQPPSGDGRSGSGAGSPNDGGGEDEQDGHGSEASESETDSDHDMMESESDSDNDDGEDERRSPRGPAAPTNRAPPPGGIRLPPAPVFQAAQAVMPPVTSPGTVQAVGRDSWMRFGADMTPFSPFETPRPVAASSEVPSVPTAMSSNSGGSARAAPGAMGPPDSSYFTHRPAVARNANGTTVAPGSNMPPPSPSVITRSRAPSSASLRTMRSGTSMPAPTPNREVPSLGPITPLNLKSSPRAKTPASVESPVSASSGRVPSAMPAAATRTASVRSTRPATSGDIRRSMGTSLASLQASMPSPSAGASTSPASPPRSHPKQRSETVAYGQYPNAPPTPRITARPSLYQQQSKSLIDLSAASRRKLDDSPPLAPVKVVKPAKATPDGGLLEPPADPPAEATRPKSKGRKDASLRRRRSMFEVRAAPPPYSIIHRRPEGPQIIYPREEEGREKLPLYQCAVHIEGFLARKMEFSAPGIQAKDRSWKRLYFVLHGTSLRVYKHDLSAAAMPKKGMWGDLSGDHVHLEPMSTVDTTGGASNSNVAPTPGQHGSTGISAAREVVLNTVPFVSNKDINVSDPNSGLLRNYTLQGAESGLAADYLKRRHVVRVRAEGEQFLLQTRNDKHVVDWIEAFQAGTNISLDLEERPMPKFITLPRRRRRRRREPANEAEREAAEIAEAQRRSLAERTGGATSRANPARPLGLPGDETPDPSAAFEEMLREEHEDMRRQAAGTL